MYLFVHCVYVWFVMAQQAVLGGGNTGTFFNVSTCYCDVILSSLSHSHSHTHTHFQPIPQYSVSSSDSKAQRFHRSESLRAESHRSER